MPHQHNTAQISNIKLTALVSIKDAHDISNYGVSLFQAWNFLNYLFIYCLFSFFPEGRGTLLQISQLQQVLCLWWWPLALLLSTSVWVLFSPFSVQNVEKIDQQLKVLILYYANTAKCQYWRHHKLTITHPIEVNTLVNLHLRVSSKHSG